MDFVKRADAQDASDAFEPLRKLARRFPVVKRHARKVLRLARAAEYRTKSRLRWLPKVRGSPGARLGVYVAYFDAAEIFRLHLTSFRQNTAGAFNYYVMKNCTTYSEARRFDDIVSEYGFPTVFTTWPPHEPFAHDDSLQRMVDQTTDEVIVVCDVDAFPVMRGWDDFILRELETKDAVGALVHMPGRAGPRTVLHPCFLAFRRSFLVAHGLQVRRHGDGDPCGRITEYLLANGRFHEGCVTPLLPTAHEMELFAGFTHDPAFGSSNLRHGFGTTYGGLVMHLWFWRIVARRRPVVGADGKVLVGVEQMEKVLASLRSRFGGAEHASSRQVPRDVPWTAHPARGQCDDK